MNEIDLSGLVLAKGNHPKDTPECCVMEAASILACAFAAPEPVPTWEEAVARFRECKTDTPEHASRVLTVFMQRLNDRATDDERQRLKPYALKLVNTRASHEVEVKRAYVLADWAVREGAPFAIEWRGFPEQAAALRSLPEVKDHDSALKARDAARPIRDALRKKAAAYAAAAAAYAYADAAAAAAYADADAAAYAADADAAAYAADAAAADADADAADADADAARSRLMDSALAAVDRALAITA
jgi:hypothetical protein